MYAVGGNTEAARRSGVKVRWIKWWAFVICSSLAVFAALLSVSRVGSVDATVGRDIVLSGVAAAVVGGVSLFGGRGRLIHAAIGALVIATITNGLGLLKLPAGYNLLITGGVLILAATVDAVSRLRSGGGRGVVPVTPLRQRARESCGIRSGQRCDRAAGVLGLAVPLQPQHARVATLDPER